MRHTSRAVLMRATVRSRPILLRRHHEEENDIPSKPSSSSFSWFPDAHSLKLGLWVGLGACLWDLFSSRKDRIILWLQESVSTRLEIRTAGDRDTYDAVLMWLANNEHCQTHTTNLTLLQHSDERTPQEEDDDREEHHPLTRSGRLCPGFGVHRACYTDVSTGERSTLWITRSVDDAMKHKNGRPGNSARVDEVLTLSCFGLHGQRGRALLMSVVQEAKELHRAVHGAKVRISVCEGGFWDHLCFRNPRPESSMVLTAAQRSALHDTKTFFESKRCYESLGIPWRRGYLLYGPPGTGKSSFVSLMATVNRAPLYLLSLRDASLTDAGLLRAVNSVPPKSILVIEDMDTILRNISGDDSSSGSGGGGGSTSLSFSHGGGNVSLSGLLNALDGVAASDGRLVVITANDPSVIPPPLLRPGRVDISMKFEPLTAAEQQQMQQRILSVLQRDVDDKEEVLASARLRDMLHNIGDQSAACVQNSLINAVLYHT